MLKFKSYVPVQNNQHETGQRCINYINITVFLAIHNNIIFLQLRLYVNMLGYELMMVHKHCTWTLVEILVWYLNSICKWPEMQLDLLKSMRYGDANILKFKCNVQYNIKVIALTLSITLGMQLLIEKEKKISSLTEFFVWVMVINSNPTFHTNWDRAAGCNCWHGISYELHQNYVNF